MQRFVIALAASLWAVAAVGADQPVYAPPAAWVKPVPVPDAGPAPGGAAIQVLLFDQQTRFGPAGDEFYTEGAVRILAPAGLSLLNSVSPSWDPQTETLTIHHLQVVRGGQVIDLLDGGKKVTVLRREKNLELAMLDGDMTATFQPEGLQVGDVVESAFTLTRRDPVLQGNSEALDVLPQGAAIRHLQLRALWAANKPVVWRATVGMPTPKTIHDAAGTEVVVDATDFTAPKPPNDAPARFAHVDQLQFQPVPRIGPTSAP